MKISVVQYQVGQTSSLAGFVSRVCRFSEQAAMSGSDLVLFPEYICVDLLNELVTRSIVDVDYDLRTALRHLPDLNEEIFDELSNVARSYDIAVAAGTFLEEAPSGLVHNAAQVFLPDGRRISQPKMHVAYEMTVNAADVCGGDALTVWELGGCRLATLVCYDAQFPESALALADHDYTIDLILVPGCALEPWGVGRIRTGTAARAMESFTFAATAHLVGSLTGSNTKQLKFWGNSAVFSPVSQQFPVDGVVVDGPATHEVTLSADLDVDLLRESRALGFPKSSDRRKDLAVRHV
jgi:predicted amidohydrolase